jgi:cyanate lyase
MEQQANKVLREKTADLIGSLADLMPQAVGMNIAYCGVAESYNDNMEVEALIYGVGKIFGNMALQIGEALELAEGIIEKLEEIATKTEKTNETH